MIITAIISIICFVALVIKYPLRKLGYHKANAKLMEYHEAASAGVFGLGIVHGCLALAKARKRGGSRCRIATGLTFFGVFTWLIAACHMTEDYEKKMKDHRALSVASTAALIAHVVGK